MRKGALWAETAKITALCDQIDGLQQLVYAYRTGLIRQTVSHVPLQPQNFPGRVQKDGPFPGQLQPLLGADKNGISQVVLVFL
jgi:hypothetical protein